LVEEQQDGEDEEVKEEGEDRLSREASLVLEVSAKGVANAHLPFDDDGAISVVICQAIP